MPPVEVRDDSHAAAAALARRQRDLRAGIFASRRWRGHQQRAGEREIGLAGAAGEQAVVTDAVKALRQHVEQEAADELVGCERHYLLTFAAASTITIGDEARANLLSAIMRSRRWAADLTEGRAENFAAIAQAEAMAERHVRFLAPLAFVSPAVITAIADGHAPARLTLSELARTLPLSWAEQERLVQARSTRK